MTSWPPSKDTNFSSMDMYSVHNVWPKPFCKAQWKGEEDKADRKRGGKTSTWLRNGQAWSLPSPRGQWRTGENGGNWLWSYLWCPNDPAVKGLVKVKVKMKEAWALLLVRQNMFSECYFSYTNTKNLSLIHRVHWGTTDDFTTSFPHFPCYPLPSVHLVLLHIHRVLLLKLYMCVSV